MSLLFFTNVILSLVFIVLLALFIVVPAPLKSSIERLTFACNYDTATNAEVKNLYTIYKRPHNKKLFVWFQGGAFLLKNRKTSYGLLNGLNDALIEFDILVFDYPIRFSHTVHDAMLVTNEILGQFNGYHEYYAGGFSAGALLMGSFMQKEKNKEIAIKMNVPIIGIQFKAMIGICGLYNTEFRSSLIESLFKFYIMRGTRSSNLYTCYGLNVPTLIIGATSEFLYPQTSKFIKQTPCQHQIYSAQLPHEFALMLEMTEAKESIEHIITFLRAN